MSFLADSCLFKPLSSNLLSQSENFDCGHSDLNDFFQNDATKYSEELLGKSYCFTLNENPEIIVCAFTVSNDSIKIYDLPGSRKRAVNKTIPRVKQMRQYPAVLIGRLGVNKDFKRKGIGEELMNFIKYWFINPNNKTGCRYIAVDSYNEEIPLAYYEKNGFVKMFSSEKQEKEYFNIPEDRQLKTRLLSFELIELSNQFK